MYGGCSKNFADSTMSAVGRRYPGSPRLAVLRARQHFLAREYDESRELLVGALALAPTFAEAHFLLAEVRSASGDQAGATASYERVLGLEPQNDRAFRQLLELEHQSGELDALIRRLEGRLRAERLDDTTHRGRLVEALRFAGREDEAKVVAEGRR
jgi:predicted TPR repeat methyltransferase